MAKKAVATFGGNRAADNKMVKCIRMDRSPRSGAYVFQEEMVQVDKVKDFFSKK